MRTLPYHQQPIKSRQCGAACLCMLYDYFGIPSDQNEIFADISINNSCRCNLMVQNITKHGLIASCISCKSLEHDIPFLLREGLEIILLHHSSPSSIAGHFSLVSYTEGDKIFVNDPRVGAADGINRRYYFKSLSRLTKWAGPSDEMGASNTMIVVSSPNGPAKISAAMVHNERFWLFPSTLEVANLILLPSSDEWTSVPNLVKQN